MFMIRAIGAAFFMGVIGIYRFRNDTIYRKECIVFFMQSECIGEGNKTL